MYVRTHISRAIFLALLAATVAVVLGCGSSGSSSESISTAGAGSTPTVEADANQAAPTFKGKAGIVKFGQPAGAADREAASAILAENLEAREKADFAKQCASLARSTQIEITGPVKPEERLRQCTIKLEALAKPLKSTEQVRADNFDGTIDEMRVKGPKAWALYHGNDGNDYAMPLQREVGTWKVGGIVTVELG